MTHSVPEKTTIGQLKAGYTTDDSGFHCLFCTESRRKGHIFPSGSHMLDAEASMQDHLNAAHGCVFSALLELGKKGTGLSETHLSLLGHFFDGLSDKEIQPLAGGVSLSTIRNHRFVLRNKVRQAKVFLALMELLDQRKQDPRRDFIDIPGSKWADDERFAITGSEYQKIISSHFPEGEEGMMSTFPRKQKRKVAVLIHIRQRFDPQRRYTQTEVNEILAGVSEDHTTLCRYLVDYGFLGRTRDGSQYWVE